jgi:hypothetical protein
MCSIASYLSTEFFMQPVPDHLKTVTCFSTSYFSKQSKSSSHFSQTTSINLVTCIRKETSCTLGHIKAILRTFLEDLPHFLLTNVAIKIFNHSKAFMDVAFTNSSFTTALHLLDTIQLLQPKGQCKNETRLQPVYGQTGNSCFSLNYGKRFRIIQDHRKR